MNQFFRYATLRFRVSSSQETTSDSGVSTGISVMFTGLANSGQNHVTCRPRVRELWFGNPGPITRDDQQITSECLTAVEFFKEE